MTRLWTTWGKHAAKSPEDHNKRQRRISPGRGISLASENLPTPVRSSVARFPVGNLRRETVGFIP